MRSVSFAKKNYSNLLAVGGLCIICLLFFHEPLFSGGIVNATDILTQQYFWNVFTKENLLTDPSFRTWLPYVNAGTPFSGGLDLIFRPVKLFTLLLFPVHIAINVEMVIYFFLSGVGMYFYMRELEVSHIGSFLAALFLMLSGQIVSLSNAGHVNKIAAIFPVGFVFWTFERALRRKTLPAFVLAGAVLSFQFWQGHVQISFYLCIAIAVYYVVRAGFLYHQNRSLKKISILTSFALIMVLVFLLLSAVEFLPLLSFAQVSDRSEGVSYEFATSWSMPPEELISYLIPGFFGFRRLNHYEDEESMIPYWGRMPFTQTGHYLGLLPLLFMLFAVCFVRNKHIVTLAMLALIILLLGMGRYVPSYKFLYDYVPGFNMFRVPQMILFLFAFATSVLAGFGAEWFFFDWSAARAKRLRIVLLAGIGCLMLTWLFIVLFPHFEPSLLERFHESLFRKGGTPDLAGARLDLIVRSAVVFNILCGLSLFVLGLRLNTNVSVKWIGLAVLGLYLVDIGLFNGKFIDTIPLQGSHYIGENDAIRYCKENPGFYRILPMTNEPASYNVSNKSVYHKLYSVSGYEAVGVQYYNDFLGQMALGTPLVDMLNIKYIILPKNVELNGETVELGKVVGPYKVVMDSDAVLLENLNVLPRAYAVHNAYPAQSKEEAFSIMLHPSFEPRESVVLEENPQRPMAQKTVPSSRSTVDITQYATRTIGMKVSMATDGFVVLSEKFYPGWKASVDGHAAKIYKANHTLQAVFIPQGNHEIEFLFQPRQYWFGFWVTCGTLLGLTAYFSTTGKFQFHKIKDSDTAHDIELPIRSRKHSIHKMTSMFSTRILAFGELPLRSRKHSIRKMTSMFSTRILAFGIRSIVYVGLGLLLVAAFLNVQYGIDHLSMIAVFSADEAFAVQLISQNLQKNHLDPQGFYNYGYLYHSLVFYTAKFLGGLNYTVDERFLAYVFRWISLASYGLLLCFAYALTKHLTKDRLFSLCAALFLASVPGVYSWAQQTHPDMLQAFLVTCAAYVACRRHNLSHVAGATILASLAFSTKYTGIFILPFVFLPFLFATIDRKRRRNDTLLLKDWRNMLCVVIGMGVIFLMVWLITNPTVLQNYSEVVKDILFEKRHVAWGDGQAESKNPLLWFTVLFHQFKANGSLLLMLGFVSLTWYARKHLAHWSTVFGSSTKRSILMLLLYSITSLAYLMLQVNLRKDRYILHLIPVLVVVGFAGLHRFIARVGILRKRKILIYAALIATILPLCMSTIQEMHEASQKYEHQYLKATAWIEQHYPAGTPILADSYSYRSPRFSHFMHVWGVERKTLDYVQPQLVIINKMLSGRWSWKKPGTKFADLDFEFGPYEAKREAVQAFHTELFASDSSYTIVYEDTEIVILEYSRKRINEQ